MITIQTLRFGEIEVKASDIVRFPEGLPGFEELISFVIVKPDPEIPFSFLQSVEDGERAFIIVSPFVFYPDYEFHITDEVERELGFESEQDVLVWNIVSIRESLEDATINLLAPVLLNAKKGLGKQVILHGTDYRVKHKLISEAVQTAPVEGGRD